MYWAQQRLEAAEERLGELGPLSQVRRKGREVKRSTVEQISAFTNDVRTAEAKIARCEQAVEELRPARDQRPRWDADHDWPDSRLRTVDAEMAELTDPGRGPTDRNASLVKPTPGRDRPPWIDRVAEIAQPTHPGHDVGHGIDLGL